MVGVQVLPESGVIPFTVKAYDPETAQQLANLITQEGEQFINRISEELANEQIDLARKEVDRAEGQSSWKSAKNWRPSKNENAIPISKSNPRPPSG